MKPVKFTGLIGAAVVIGMIFLNLSCSPTLPEVERIVLVTFDTLRADHLGCYGYPRPTSPFIDQLAARGQIFRQAYTPMPTTIPAHAALFTSRYPVQLNVVKNGHVLDGGYTTLAEQLRENGFFTGAFTAVNHLFGPANLDQGFDYFQEPELADDVLYDPANRVVDRVISWLDEKSPANDLFLWIHFFDPHGPYRPPDRYLQEIGFKTEKEKSAWRRYLLKEKKIDPGFFASLPDMLIQESIDCGGNDPGEWNGEERMVRINNAYDGEVRFIDSQLKRLHNYFERRGLAKGTAWIITSDHGEGLGNHEWIEHSKYLYNEQVHVPLVFYSPGLIPPADQAELFVSLIDIFPTIIDLAGKKSPEHDSGKEGKTLHPFLIRPDSGMKQYNPGEGVIFTQRREYNYNENPDDLISPRKGYKGESYSLQNSRYKYILQTAGPDELYDLAEDHCELDNLSGKRASVEAELKQKVSDKVEYLRRGASGDFREVEPVGLEKLKSLGYVQ